MKGWPQPLWILIAPEKGLIKDTNSGLRRFCQMTWNINETNQLTKILLVPGCRAECLHEWLTSKVILVMYERKTEKRKRTRADGWTRGREERLICKVEGEIAREWVRVRDRQRTQCEWVNPPVALISWVVSALIKALWHPRVKRSPGMCSCSQQRGDQSEPVAATQMLCRAVTNTHTHTHTHAPKVTVMN